MTSSHRSRNLRRSRPARGENLAPSLFPFLAVLLCTMGSLVLILVLVVSQASASSNRPTPADDQLQAAADSIHLVSEEMIAQREQQQREIEKRRLELTSVEEHISKLTNELEHYRETAKAIDDRKSQTKSERDEKQKRVEDLKSKVESEKDRLEEFKAKAKGNTPAFAIFPYQGRNGTTRRPIYLECIESGVIIQPEGTLLSIDDLKPPFGPGNPLDSSLRLIRNEFQKLDPNATTGISPYPLLLVRPNGIKAYVLARAAMAGWDDQFGYELLDQDMPLAFPSTVPGLAGQLENNLVVARERQIALSAAMPRRYAGGQPWEEELDALDSATNPSENGSGFSDDDSGSTSFGEDWTAIDSSFVPSPFQPMSQSSGQTPEQPAGYGQQPQPPPPSSAASLPSSGSARISSERAALQSNRDYRIDPHSVGGGGQDFDATQSNSNMDSLGSDAPNGSQANGSQALGAIQNGTSTYGNPTTGQANNQMSTSRNTNTASSSSSLTAGNSMEPAQPGQDPTQSFTGTTAREQAAMSGNQPDSNALSIQRNLSPSKPEADTKPSSQTKPERRSRSNSSKGNPMAHNWSSRRQDTNSTAVTRPVNIVVMDDRWLVMRDGAPDKIETTITMEKGPLEARNQLFQSISNRVDSWGVAVSEGYWQPKLTVEVTPQSELSAQRLKKLLEGSDLEAEFVPLQPTKR